MDDIAVTPPAETPPPERYVCLEIFGHRQHFGRLVEVEQFGAKFARIEMWCAKGHPLPLSPAYAGAAIFSVTDLPGGRAEAMQQTGSYGCPHPDCTSTRALPSYEVAPSGNEDPEEPEPYSPPSF